MSILTPTISVTVIWALFIILTITVSLQFYAIRIHNRRKEQRLARHTNRNSPSPPSPPSARNGLFTSNTVLTTSIITLHILTLLYCVAATLAVIWGYDLAEKRLALAIQNGGAESGVGDVLLGEGEVGRLRRNVQKVGVAMELGYVVVTWTLKCGVVAVGWQVGKGLYLWGDRSLAEVGIEKVVIAGAEAGNAGREGPMPMSAETKARISMAKAALYTLGCGTVMTFLVVIIYEAIVIGMTLSRNEVEDITSHGLKKEVIERQNATIVSAIGSLGTYLLSILLSIMLLSISRSPHQPQPHPHPLPPIFLYGGISILTLLLLTTASSSARTGSILKNTHTIQPRVGDLITPGILFGRATGSTYGESLGLNEKVFSVMEMMFGGVAICLPGMRVLFESARRRGGKRTRSDLYSKRGRGRRNGGGEEDLRGLQAKSQQPSAVTSEESTFRPTETSVATIIPAQKNNQEIRYPPRGYPAMTVRNQTFSQENTAIGTRTIIQRERNTSRSRSRSRSRSGSRSRRNRVLDAPAGTPPPLPQAGKAEKQRQIEEQLEWIEEQQWKQRRQQWEQDFNKEEGEELSPHKGKEKSSRHHHNDPPETSRHQEKIATTTTRGDSNRSLSAVAVGVPPAALQRLRISPDKSLPPLPPVCEWELARDRELQRNHGR